MRAVAVVHRRRGGCWQSTGPRVVTSDADGEVTCARCRLASDKARRAAEGSAAAGRTEAAVDTMRAVLALVSARHGERKEEWTARERAVSELVRRHRAEYEQIAAAELTIAALAGR